MRVQGNQQTHVGSWITALLIFLAIIVVIQFVERRSPAQEQLLQQQFAASPPAADAGQIEIPPIPTNMIALARTTTARLFSGQAGAPLNTVAENETLRVEIASIKSEGENLKLSGTITNIGGAPVTVSLDAFKFIDASGTVYASSGGPTTTLEPGQNAPLDITLPLANPTVLKLEVEQPNQSPIELQLVNTPPTPTQ
ncbi:MAG TPA: hypothetical protein VGD58_03440 [Herpetosiphonaceae bacterium]